MILKALELHGFKSFPDKTVLTFDGEITAVVGPNGSGKSNISDAIRWVLGEQSSKQLRGGKMEDVIFNGTEKRQGMGFAEVSLVIDNSARTLDSDADEVRVTRRYYRSGESEYMINRVKVRLKDVQMLFMDTGLGRDGYSIIGQGRIGDIVSSRLGERRRIFEEAAGIAKYRYRKTEAENRLSAAQENLLRLYDILKELEERVGPLQAQSEKAKKYLVLAQEKRELEISVWLRDMDVARDRLRDLSAKLEMVRSQYDRAGDAMDDFDRQIEEIGTQGQLLEVQMDELRRTARAHRDAAAELQQQVAVLRNDAEHNTENAERVRAEIAREDEGGRLIDEAVAACMARIVAREQEIAEAERQRVELSEQMQELIRSSDSVTGEMDALNARAAALDVRLSDLRVASVTDASSLTEITARLEQLSELTAQRTAQEQSLSVQLAEMEQALAACRERIEELKNAAAGYEMRANARLSKLEEARQNADRLHLDAEGKARRVQMLEELERNMEGFAQSVKLVMKQAGRGVLPGILGPVSRLIATEGEYALAIETALGAAAQNLVCEREDDAKRAIAFLKQEKAGRATFLPLTSVRGRLLEEKGVEDAAGFVGIASELVTFDARYADVINSLLGRTVIAEDLDSAVAIARKFGYRFRVVTLDGQVVNAGGSLTGGSSVKGAGLMSRRAEIERLSADVAALRDKVEKARAVVRDVQQEAAAAQAALSGARGELTQAQEDGIRFDGEVRRLSEQLALVRRDMASAEEETAALSTRGEECRRRSEEAQAQTAVLTAEKAELEAQIVTLSGGRAQLSQTREELSGRMSDLGLAVLGYRKDIEAEQQSVAQFESRRADAGAHRVALENEIAAYETANAAIEAQIVQLGEQTQALFAQADACDAQIEQLMQQRTAGEEQITALRTQMRSCTDERENTTREIARLEEQCNHAQQTSDTVARRLYEEYELTTSEAAAIARPLDDPAAAGRRLTELKNKIRALGSVNVDAIEEYKEVSARYEFLSVQVKDVETSRDELLGLIDELTGQMKELFLDRFRKIQYHFGIVFAELFGGGKGEIELEDASDVLGCGILLNVQPPGKKIHNIDALSGGEKALTAIALLFAILKVTPSPFCVLDEIEAALDDVNVDRYAAYLRRLCDKSQFIAITHRRGTMEEADVLYGVTMQEKGVSKLLELRASEVEQRLGIETN